MKREVEIQTIMWCTACKRNVAMTVARKEQLSRTRVRVTYKCERCHQYTTICKNRE